MSDRKREGPTIHDGAVEYARICPRQRTDCYPIARYASPGPASFMCCGETDSAPVPTDTLRLCVFSSHDQGPMDVMFNLDERDATDIASVLLAGLSMKAASPPEAP